MLDSGEHSENALRLILSGVQNTTEYQALLAEYHNPSGADISSIATTVFDIKLVDRNVVFAIPLNIEEAISLIDSGAHSVAELASESRTSSQRAEMAFGKFAGDEAITPIHGVDLLKTPDPPYCYLEVDLNKLKTTVFSGGLVRNKGALQDLFMEKDDSVVLLRQKISADCLTLKLITSVPLRTK